MSRVEAIRSEVRRLLRVVPFCPFAMNFENGDRVIIGNHSEYHNGEKIQPRDVSGGAARTGREG